MCPNTIITFTCSDILVYSMVWYARPFLNEDNSPDLGPNIEIGNPRMVEGVFTITVVARQLMPDNRGNFTSTLDVVVNDRIQNKTSVTCSTLSSMASLLIFKQGLFYYMVICNEF